MPELPEVETTVRGLAPHLTGQRLVRVSTLRLICAVRSPSTWRSD